MSSKWRNWAGNLTASPQKIWTPESLDDLVAIAKSASQEKRRIRTHGSSYSWAALVPTSDYLVSFERLNRCLEVDQERQTVKVEPGINVWEMTEAAAKEGLTFPTMTIVPWITAGGAIAAGCHGTGRDWKTVSDLVVAVEMVLADGSVRTITQDDPADLLNAVRLSLGCLGMIYSITFQCVPMFRLHAVDEVRDLADTLDRLEEIVAANDYVEILWMPYTDIAWIKRWNKTEAPISVSPFRRRLTLINQYLSNYLAGGQLLRLMSTFPSLTPRLIPILKRCIVKRNIVDLASEVLHYQHYFVRFWDLSYGLPISKARAGFEVITNTLERFREKKRFPLNMVISFRFVAGSNALISPAFDGPTCFLEQLTYISTPDFEPFYKEVEDQWLALGGRPHWGKVYYQTAEIPGLYGDRMERFLAVRQELDPGGVFLNEFLEEVLGLSSLSNQSSDGVNYET